MLKTCIPVLLFLSEYPQFFVDLAFFKLVSQSPSVFCVIYHGLITIGLCFQGLINTDFCCCCCSFMLGNQFVHVRGFISLGLRSQVMPASSPTENDGGSYDVQVTQSIISQDTDFSAKNIRNSHAFLFILQYRSLSHAEPSVCWLHHKSVNELVSVQSSAFFRKFFCTSAMICFTAQPHGPMPGRAERPVTTLQGGTFWHPLCH